MIEQLALIFLIACASSTPIKNENSGKIIQDTINYRLPTNAKPVHYNLTLEPDLETFIFSGFVEIDVEITEASNNITLHSNELTILDIKVFDSLSTEISVSNITFDVLRQFLIISFAQNLEVASYQVQITFTGVLNNLNKGFYRSSYININGETRWLATTQFEPTDARMAYPCFDEPGLKATYDVNLVRNSTYNSISNTRLSNTWQKGEKFVDVFETTPPMSSYLTAFIVSDFSNITDNGRHRVFARPEAVSNGDADFALEMGIGVLSALETFTNIPFSIQKMDQISIPDFAAGAMENWGLVTYRESALLWNAAISSTSSKQGVLSVIGHEFVHQWFGDLVSPKWWKYLWLNEGFATFLSSQVTNMVKPSWRMAEQFIGTKQSSFDVDSRPSRPMSSDVGSPDEINALFDNVSYSKAGSVLYMLQNAISDLLFRAGLTRYLTNKQFTAAESADLWGGIQEIIDANAPNLLGNNLTVSQIMTTWETQAGYPLITVTRNYLDGSVTFSQQIFSIAGVNPNDTSRWYVPINYAVAGNPNFTSTQASDWLSSQSDLVLNLNLLSADWLIINNQGTGYYRVNYDDENWNLITSYMNTTDFDKIHLLNRAQLIDDAFNLAKTGHLNYTIALKVTNYLHRESDYIVHSSFFRALGYFDRMASGSALYQLFEDRVGTILDKALNELGFAEVSFDDTEHVHNLHRIDVISWACRMNNNFCRTQATARLSDILSVSVNLQTPIFCGGLRGADEATWDMVDAFSNTVTGTISSRLVSALGCSENVAVLTKYIEREMNQTSSGVFGNIFNKGNFGKNFVFNYILTNFDKIYQTFGGNSGNIVVSISSLLTTQDELTKLEQLKTTADPSLAASFDAAIVNVKSNLIWTDVYLPDITRWIQNEL